jgi:transcriptional regulator with XRE-family HTH domain
MINKPTINSGETLMKLGAAIREHRKALGINAIAAAEAAGISRVTLHRIERGEATVNIGAYVNVMLALGLNLAVKTQVDGTHAGFLPAHILLDDYPQLKKLAWQLKAGADLSPSEALSVYERNWRHIDHSALDSNERQLIDALRMSLARGGAPNV